MTAVSPQVDLRLLEAPPAACLLEVFGEVHIADGRPYILAKVSHGALEGVGMLKRRAVAHFKAE